MRTTTLVFLAMLGSACARSRGGDGGTTAVAAAAARDSAAAPEPCTVPVPEGHGEWRQMRGDGFTFCVPKSWRPASPPSGERKLVHAFYHSGGRIEWSTRGFPRRSSAITTTTMPVERRFTEVIGGLQAELWTVQWTRISRSGATWRDSQLVFVGEGEDPWAATIQLAVYRTVRFTE